MKLSKQIELTEVPLDAETKLKLAHPPIGVRADFESKGDGESLRLLLAATIREAEGLTCEGKPGAPDTVLKQGHDVANYLLTLHDPRCEAIVKMVLRFVEEGPEEEEKPKPEPKPEAKKPKDEKPKDEKPKDEKPKA